MIIYKRAAFTSISAAFIVSALFAAPAVHASTAPPTFDITIGDGGFTTNDSGYKGISVNYRLEGADASEVVSSSVALYSGTTLLATNTSKSAEKVNEAKAYSSAFRTVIGTYTTSGTWNLGDTSWTPRLSEKPTKAVITLTDSRGNTYTSERSSLNEHSGGIHISWEKMLPSNIAPDPTTPTVVSDATEPLVIEVDSGASGAKLDYSGLLTSGAGDIPKTTIFTGDGISVAIPKTRITADDKSWDGELQTPTVVSNTSVTIPAESGSTVTVATAINVGAATTRLTFDEGVRLLLPGQADMLVGFDRDGTFTPITAECSADTQTAGDALAAGGDCFISVGGDMVIWTKHFTTFAAYSFAATPATAGLVASGDDTPVSTLLIGSALLLAVGTVVLVARSRVAAKR